jgi:hypothetical protein
MNTKRIRKWLVKFGLAPTCALAMVIFILVWSMRTHAQNSIQNHVPVHVINDWSNRHMVYSAPSSPSLEQKLKAEPRYLNQLSQRNNAAPQAQSAR